MGAGVDTGGRHPPHERRLQQQHHCLAIASDGTTFWAARSTDFGHTWERQGTLPGGLQEAGDLSCVSGASCLVTGFTATTAGHGQGSIVTSTDDGVTWTAATVPAGTGIVHSAVCADSTTCLAVGTTSTSVSAIVPAKGAELTSDTDGQTWTRTSVHQPIDDIYGVECPSPLVCAMVGTEWVGQHRPSVPAPWRNGITYRACSRRRGPNTPRCP